MSTQKKKLTSTPKIVRELIFNDFFDAFLLTCPTYFLKSVISSVPSMANRITFGSRGNPFSANCAKITLNTAGRINSVNGQIVLL